MKKVICGVVVCTLLASVSMAATYRFNNQGVGSDWGTPNNWDLNAVPTAADTARFNWGGASGTVSSPESIGALQVGVDESGNLTLNNALTIGSVSWSGMGAGLAYDGADDSTITINSAGLLTVNNGWRMGNTDSGSGGGVNLVIDGGEMNVTAGGFTQTRTQVNSLVTLLNGGILRANALTLSTGTIDLSGGSMIINGDVTGSVSGWVSGGWLIADGGAGVVGSSFDGSVTTVAAIPEPATIGLMGLGTFLAMIINRIRFSVPAKRC